MLCACDGGCKNGFNQVILLNRTENKQDNKKGILWLQTTHVGLLILCGLVSAMECLLCWKNLAAPEQGQRWPPLLLLTDFCFFIAFSKS